MTHFYVKAPNKIDVDIANRVIAAVSVATDAKMVRNLAFEILLTDGVIPPQAKVGWLTDPGRRRGCSTKHNEYLDGLNRLFNAAKYHFGEDGKKTRATDGKPSHISVRFTGQLLSAADGTFVLDFSDAPNACAIEELARLNLGRRVEICFTPLTSVGSSRSGA